MFGAVTCFLRREHDWEHRVALILLHYWRCKRCHKQVPMGDPAVPVAVVEADRASAIAFWEKAERERAEYDAREEARYQAIRAESARRSKQFMRAYRAKLRQQERT